jgi:hypothetical protein
MAFLIQGAPDVAEAKPLPPPAITSSDVASEPASNVVAPTPISVGVVPTVSNGAAIAALPVTATPAKPGKALSMKIADSKAARIEAHNALNYDFVVPETDQRCELVGQLHGTGGFDSALETFLLTDDEYLFWHANQAAIPHSSWETIRGSETALHYDLPGAGTYHLVISNEMSPSSKIIQVKVQVKCAK